MACQKCGCIIQDGLSVCPVCGADLTVQSNYKRVDNKVNSNNVDSSNVITTTTEVKVEKHKNKIVIALIIMVSLVAIAVLLVVSGVFNFSSNKNTSDGELRDIKTVNDDSEVTSKTTKITTTKTTSNSENNTSTIKGGESVVINDITFTVPNAYEFGYSNEEQRDYYLIRRDANVVISFSFGTIDTSLEDIFNELVESYSNEKLIEYTQELYNYKDYNYYRFVHKEEINRNKYKEHVEIIMQINDDTYVNAYMYEPVDFGEQNYIQTFTSFISSGINRDN